MAAAGQAIFTDLPVIFAIGIAIGLTGGEGATGTTCSPETFSKRSGVGRT